MRRLLLTLAFLVSLASPAWAVASLVQVGKATASSGTTITVTMPGSTTTGNCLGVGIRDDGETIASVADGSNTFSAIDSETSHDPFMFSYKAAVTTGTAANIVVTLNTATSFALAYVWEVAGEDSACTVDGHDSKSLAAGPTDITSNAVTTTTTGIVLFAASASGGSTYTAGTNYTLNENVSGDFGAQYRITGSALSSEVQHITTSNSGGQNTLVVIAFKDAGGGGGATTGCTGRRTLMGAGCDD